MRRARVLNALRAAVPIFRWMPEYNAENAVGDLIAGITVGLTLIPQSIAYAALAGLEPQYGLYSSLCGGFIYACFGTVKDLNIAPTALISLLTYTYTKDYAAPDAAIFLCFAAGVLQLLFGIFRLGFLVSFVSAPVVSGFTSAGALTIAASQVKSMLGLKFRAESFIDVVYNVCKNIAHTKLEDAGLSAVCCVLLIGLREIRRWGQAPSAPNAKPQRVTIWFISVGRNALIVIATSICAYFLHEGIFTLTNTVPDGLPEFALPFQAQDFLEHLQHLAKGIFVVALVAILSNMAIAKAFSTGQVLNASHEMSTLGLCNLFGSFFGSFPVNASFSRAALNNASGARTAFGGIYTGIMVILSLTFLTKYFVFIPKAALASVIFCAVIYMVEVAIVMDLWRTSKMELIPLGATFFWSLGDSIERGILIGIVVDILMVVWASSKPKITETSIANESVNCIQLSLEGNLTYLSGESVRSQVTSIIKKKNDIPVINNDTNISKSKNRMLIIFDCDKLQQIDYSAAKAFGAMMDDLLKSDENIDVLFVDLRQNLRVKIENITNKTLKCVENSEISVVLQKYSEDTSNTSEVVSTTF